MCVYGLHPRENSLRTSAMFPSSQDTHVPISSPTKSAQNNSAPSSPLQKKKDKKRPPYDSILGRNIFEWSWYCFPPQQERGSAREGEVFPFIKGIGSALKLVSNPSVTSLTTTPHNYLRFTRSSTPSSLLLPEMTSNDSSLSEEGCYIGLCRVLINSVHNVPSDREISSSDIMEALRTGCDTVYSEKRFISSTLLC